MTTFKLAWRLAFSADIQQRWRQVSVIFAGLVGTLLALTGVAMVHASADSDARISARSPVWAQTDSDAIVRLSARGLTLPGFGQFPVVWLEPVAGHEHDPAAVPPGLRQLPRPGEAVLSEGLVMQGFTAPDFGLLPSAVGSGSRGAIGRDGLSTVSEGWIYARPGPGRSLGQGGALLLSEGYPGDASTGIAFETIPEIPRSGETLLGAAWMLVGPMAFLLLTAARAISSVRDARAQTLWRLGVASARIRTLLAVETGLLTLAGASPGAAAWWLWISRAEEVPLTVARLHPGALRVPVVQVIGVLLGVVLIAGLSVVAGRVRERALRRDARLVRPWHATPLVVAFLMMAAGPWLSPSSGVRLYLLFGGLLLTFAALPMALPAVVAQLGTHLGRSSRAHVWLAGRRLALRSANLAKPAALVGVLVFVAGAAFALYDRLVSPEENRGFEAPFAAFQVDWRDQRPDDLLAATAAAPPTLAILPLSRNSTGAAEVHFTTCDQFERWAASSSSCDTRGHITTAGRAQFESLTGAAPVVGGGRGAESLFVLGDRNVTAADVMKVLASRLPAVNINATGGVSKMRDPRAGWMLAGWTVATLVLIAALLREIGDRGLSSMQDVRHLLRLGLRREEIEGSYRWTLLAPVAVSIPIGFAGATLFALLGYELGITIGNLARIAVVAGSAGLAAVVTFSVVLHIQHKTAGLSERGHVT